MPSLPKVLFNQYDQVILFGANGWFGRSCLDVLIREEINLSTNILLIGSKTTVIAVDGKNFPIFSSFDALNLIKSNSLFINAAYLRREKMQGMSKYEYTENITSLESFPSKLLEKSRIETFINLSSGVANEYSEDLYARLKWQSEIKFSQLCKEYHSNFINCRIFSMTGKNINEFQNLALSSFIQQAKSAEMRIAVKSPRTLRTYSDASQIAEVLLNLSLSKPKALFLDSGGILISLGDLARNISRFYPGSRVEFEKGELQSPNYFGDFKSFNQLVDGFDLRMLTIGEQIQNSIKAFH